MPILTYLEFDKIKNMAKDEKLKLLQNSLYSAQTTMLAVSATADIPSDDDFELTIATSEANIVEQFKQDKISSDELHQHFLFRDAQEQLADSIRKLQSVKSPELAAEAFKTNAAEGISNNQLMKDFADAIISTAIWNLRNTFHVSTIQEITEYQLPQIQILDSTAKLVDGVAAVFKNPKNTTALQDLLAKNSEFAQQLDNIASTEIKTGSSKFEYSEQGRVYNIQQRAKAITSLIFGFIGASLIVLGTLGVIPTFGGSVALIAIGTLALTAAAATRGLKMPGAIARPEVMGAEIKSPGTSDEDKRAIKEAKEILKSANSSKGHTFLGDGNKKAGVAPVEVEKVSKNSPQNNKNPKV